MLEKRYNKRSRTKRTLMAIGIALIVVFLGGGIAAQRVYSSNLKPFSNSETSQIFTVESGWSAQQIADDLESKQLIRKSWAFQWYVRNNNLRDQLQAGTYALKPSQSVQEIVEIMTQGKVDTSFVTILPAKRLDEIRDKLINYGFDAGEVDAALNPDVYKGHAALVDKPAGASLEGYLYPETFQRTRETKPETIIRASLDQMALHLTPEVRAGIVAQGLTVHQGVILASIVEQEVNIAADKPKVAQVFIKRLKIGMQLGSDVTAVYGAIQDGVELPDNPATAANVAIANDSPYNTRKYSGLPPGPISNSSQASLEAIANPSAGDFLFFVAGDDGVTYFSKTLQEHEALANQHCKKLCGR